MKTNLGKTLAASLAVGVLVIAVVALADQKADDDAIRKAVLNYTAAIYEAKPKLIDESVHPRVQKVGYAPKKEGDGYREMWMTHAELRELCAHWNSDGHVDPATARQDVKILDRLDQVAVVRLDAEWGVDYLQLAKDGKKWMIINVIWQTYPAE